MKKHKNEKYRRLPKLITERDMFLKMQNFSAFMGLIILTAAKKCKKDFTKEHDFLCLSYMNCLLKGSFEASI